MFSKLTTCIVLLVIGVAGLSLFWHWNEAAVGKNGVPLSAADATTTGGEVSDHETRAGKKGVAASPDSTERMAAENEDVLMIPATVALVPGEQVPAANNWEELVAHMSPEDRELAEVLANRYPEAYTFSSVEQLEWMLAAGYPMPQEFVAAQKMSDDELLQMAISGNKKAQFLDMERYLNDDRPMTDDEKVATSVHRLSPFEQEGKTTCSPFYGYLRMKFIDRYYSGGDPRGSLADLARIYKSGDWRAERAAQVLLAERVITPAEWGAAVSAASDAYGCGIGPIPR